MKLSERITIAIIVGAVLTLVYVLVRPLAYDTAELEDAEPRNPWGQHLPLDMEELCDGTVLQWHTECERRKAEAEAEE